MVLPLTPPSSLSPLLTLHQPGRPVCSSQNSPAPGPLLCPLCPTSAWNALFSRCLLCYLPLFLLASGDVLVPKRGPPGLSARSPICA